MDKVLLESIFLILLIFRSHSPAWLLLLVLVLNLPQRPLCGFPVTRQARITEKEYIKFEH